MTAFVEPQAATYPPVTPLAEPPGFVGTSLANGSSILSLTGMALCLAGPLAGMGSLIATGVAASMAGTGLDLYETATKQWFASKYASQKTAVGLGMLSNVCSFGSMAFSLANMSKGFIKITPMERYLAIGALGISIIASAYEALSQGRSLPWGQTLIQGGMAFVFGMSSQARNPFRLDHVVNKLPKAVIMVSKDSEHCLKAMMKKRWWGRVGGLPIGKVKILSGSHLIPSAQKPVTSKTLAARYEVPIKNDKLMGTFGSEKREAHLKWIAEELEAFQPDATFLAKYMAILPEWLLKQHPNRIINVHHGQLPGLAGRRALTQAVMEAKMTSATCHFVTPVLDAGPIITQSAFSLNGYGKRYEAPVQDVVEMLIPRMKKAEARALVKGAGYFLNGRVKLIPNEGVPQATLRTFEAYGIDPKAHRVALTGWHGVWGWYGPRSVYGAT